MEKLVQVVMCPSNKSFVGGDLVFNDTMNTLFIAANGLEQAWEGMDSSHLKAQHIHFISNEELKENDWFVWKDEVYQYDYDKGYGIQTKTLETLYIGDKPFTGNAIVNHSQVVGKVIATTDTSLKLPIIPKLFVESFVKNNGKIKEVKFIVNKTLSGVDEIGIQVDNTIYYIQGKLAIEYLLPKLQTNSIGNIF